MYQFFSRGFKKEDQDVQSEKLFKTLLIKKLGRYGGFFLQTRCLVCGRPLSENNSFLACCSDCLSSLKIRKRGFCPLCGNIYANKEEQVYLCLDCRQKNKPWERFGFYRPYEGLLRDLILQYKYRGNLGFNKILQELLILAYRFHFSMTDPPEVIVPIPIHKRRLKSRGFNQSLEITRGLARSIQARIEPEALQRIKDTPSQSGLNRKERWQNVQDSMVGQKGKVKDRHVLIVDDVYTTGATLTAGVKALYKRGAKRVDVLVLARAKDV